MQKKPPDRSRAALDALHETAQKMRFERHRACFLLRSSACPGRALALTRAAPPLVGLASLPEVVPTSCSAVIGSALPLRRLDRSPRPWGLPSSPVVRESPRTPRSASPRVDLPFRVLPGRPAGALSGSSASRGVPSPTAYPVAGTHNPGICLVPVPVRLQGSSPPAALRPPRPIRPFPAGNAPGVLPFEAFPSARSRGASRRPLPSCRSPPANRGPKTARGRTDPTSGPCSPAESVDGRTGVSRSAARCSLGVLPL